MGFTEKDTLLTPASTNTVERSHAPQPTSPCRMLFRGLGTSPEIRESHGGKSLVGYSPWGRKESDTSERLHFPVLVKMLKILQARLQQYVNHELSDVQAGFRKGRDQTANICRIIEKAREFQKNIYFCFIDYAKAFDCVDHNKLWKFLEEMGIPDHLTCLLRNLYAGQEATVRTGHGTKDWFQIGKGVGQGCTL